MFPQIRVFDQQVILLLILVGATSRETLFLLIRLHYDYYRNINLNLTMFTIDDCKNMHVHTTCNLVPPCACCRSSTASAFG